MVVVLRNKVFFQRVKSMSAHLHNTHMCMDRSHFVKTPIEPSAHQPPLRLMAPKTKKDFVAEMMQLGEVPPEKWGITELKVRLAELREERGLNQKNPQQTDLQQWVLLLNRASRKKADLQKFNHNQLQLAVAENATIAQLQKQAIERIYQMSKADPTDPVGFGEHSALSYQEILVSQPSYCKWVIQTSSEGQCCARLTRLATWLLVQKDKPVPVPVPVAMPAKKGNSASSDVSASSTAALVGVMQRMMVKMDEMKEEIDEIRGRPHKKAVKNEEMDDQSSWSPLTET